MNIKQIFVGIFTASLFSLSIATEANSSPPDSLSGAPRWVLNLGDGAYSAVGFAPIVEKRGKDKKNIEIYDVDVAEYEAIRKAKDSIYQEINQYVQIVDKALIVKIEPASYAVYKQIEELKPTDIWISHDGRKIAVLIKPSMGIINQIRKLIKTKEEKTEEEKLEVKELTKDAPEWVFKNNNPFTAVGITPVVLTKTEGLVSVDIELTKSKAVNKAKEKLAKEIEINISSAIDKNIKTLVEKGEIKRVERYSTMASKIADTAEIKELWMNQQAMCVLIKLPQYSIKKIEQIKKIKIDRGRVVTN